ncbi:MAG TPA: radical SAM protein [Candidatus Methanoperedens sp.]|nr:radical SAM protein [Candidatus Methanoperedens sp.]
MKTFAVYNFGCRVNAAETNLFAQSLINKGYLPDQENPNTIFVNTCSITKKANKESVGLVRRLQKKFPNSKIIVSGCANLDNISPTKNISILNNQEKETKLLDLNCTYTHKIHDKFSNTNRFLLKVQSGCTAFCTYCTVPFKRFHLWSLPIETAIDTVKKAVADGYQEVIITGVNLNQYQPGFSNLVEALLKKTDIPLISFGSIPINCVDEKFLSLVSSFSFRISNFFHIPIQSGSDKILKLMKRNYTKKIILEKFELLKKIASSTSSPRNDVIASDKLPVIANYKLPVIASEARQSPQFGTDIIVGFPGETDADFQETYDLCKKIGFSKIHVFKYSPRPNTIARKLFLESEKLSKETVKSRSKTILSIQLKN